MSKRVLIITYYWPPSGGIGVLRCLKIAKYLREYGWEPIIYTPQNAHYPFIDHSNDKDIPVNAEILKTKIWEPFSLYKILTGRKKSDNVNNVLNVLDGKASLMHKFSVWVRSNFFIPDARAMWIKPSVKYLKKYLKSNPVDAMFTCGPPHTNTRIATLLKKDLGIPYLADFQDPWTQVDYFSQLILTKWGLAKHKRQEQEAFAAADAMTIVSKSWKKDIESIGAKNVSVLYWGYDPDDYKNRVSSVDKKFTLSHLGLMGHDRNPTVLFEVLEEIMQEQSEFKTDFELRLAGEVDYTVENAYKRHNLEENVNFLGSVSRKDALQMTMNSNILLLLLNQQDNAQGRVPGKFFEYLASRRPIISLGHTNGDVADILRETGHGEALEYEDKESIKKVILSLYRKYKAGTLNQPLEGDISNYSHKVLTGKVADILNNISL